MRSALVVLTIFAAAWAGAGLIAAGFAPAWAILPVAISGALLLWGWGAAADAERPGPHVGKLIARWSMIEGAALLIAANVLNHLHRAEFIFPAAAAIVGLHFLPLARGIPVRLYHATAAGLVLVGVCGAFLPVADRPLAVALCAAAILWATAIVRILQARRAAVSA